MAAFILFKLCTLGLILQQINFEFIFGGLECVGLSFAYVAHFVF
jgi:hypothetical protein